MIPKGLEDGKPFPTREEMTVLLSEAYSVLHERRLTSEERDIVFHGLTSLIMYEIGHQEGQFYDLLQPYMQELAVRPDTPKATGAR